MKGGLKLWGLVKGLGHMHVLSALSLRGTAVRRWQPHTGRSSGSMCVFKGSGGLGV